MSDPVPEEFRKAAEELQATGKPYLLVYRTAEQGAGVAGPAEFDEMGMMVSLLLTGFAETCREEGQLERFVNLLLKHIKRCAPWRGN